MLFQTLDTLCLTVDERMAKVDFWNSAARKRENRAVIVSQEQRLKTAGIVNNAYRQCHKLEDLNHGQMP